MHAYLCFVSIGLLCIFWLFILVFGFCFLSTSQEIGWKEHLQNDLFCIERDVITRSIDYIPLELGPQQCF